MDEKPIVAIVIMLVVCFGCAGLFWGIGAWAMKRKDPMHFYSGSSVDPRTISDIPGYNAENAKMWRQYSFPFWLSGIMEILGIFDDRLLMPAVYLMVAASTVGAIWLVRRYQKICKIYMI